MYKVAAVYLAMGFLLWQVAEIGFEALGMPDVALTLLVVLTIAGFPLALVLAWASEAPGTEGPPPSHVRARSVAAGATAEPPERSLVVLPFVNVSPDAENEYFSDGLTEEIIADLSQVRSLKVISRTSCMLLKNTEKDLRTLGRELGVRYALEGSVRKAGDALRVTAQLIDTADDVHLWAEKYDGGTADVFAIQEEISRAIADALRIALTPEEERAIERRPMSDARAYEYYLRAWHEIWQLNAASIERAIRLLEAAEERVADNPYVLAAMGEAYFLLPHATSEDIEGNFAKLEELVERLRVIAPDGASTHTLAGFVSGKRERPIEAARSHARSVLADPTSPSALMWAGFWLGQAGHFALAEPWLGRLLEIEPLSPHAYLINGYVRALDGQLDAAVQSFDQGREIDPNSAPVWSWRIVTLALAGRTEEVLRAASEYARFPDDNWRRWGRLYAAALQGDLATVDELCTPDFEAITRWDESFSFAMAQCRAIIGQAEEALEWLHNAVRRGFVHYPFLREREPYISRLRGDPRYERILEEAERLYREVGEAAGAVLRVSASPAHSPDPWPELARQGPAH